MKSKKTSKTDKKQSPSTEKSVDDGQRTISLLQKIQAGTVDPTSIRVTERHLIVNYLMADGYPTAQMARILKISDRTIERDKKAIREANALAADPQLVEQMVGRLVCEAELSIQRIRKAARDKDTPPAVRIDAEHRCYQITSDMTTSLRHLGYLPTATSRLQADFTHNIGQIPDLPQMQMEVRRLRQITGETSRTDPQLTKELDLIEGQLVQVELADKIENISKSVESGEAQNESHK